MCIFFVGIPRDCQGRRDSKYIDTETWLVDPDGAGGLPPFPAFCQMITNPPIGMTVSMHANRFSMIRFIIEYLKIFNKSILLLLSNQMIEKYTY